MGGRAFPTELKQAAQGLRALNSVRDLPAFSRWRALSQAVGCFRRAVHRPGCRVVPTAMSSLRIALWVGAYPLLPFVGRAGLVVGMQEELSAERAPPFLL